MDQRLTTEELYKELVEATRSEPLTDEERITQKQCKELTEMGFTSNEMLRPMAIKGIITQKECDNFKKMPLTDYDFFMYLIENGAITNEAFQDLIDLAKSRGITKE